MTPIEEIREAVRVLRETAALVPPGPWGTFGTAVARGLEVTGVGSYTAVQPVAEAADADDWDSFEHDDAVEVDPSDTAAYMALMDPPVALALADLLADIAAYHESWGTNPALTAPKPLEIARAVLKREVGR